MEAAVHGDTEQMIEADVRVLISRDFTWESNVGSGGGRVIMPAVTVTDLGL